LLNFLRFSRWENWEWKSTTTSVSNSVWMCMGVWVNGWMGVGCAVKRKIRQKARVREKYRKRNEKSLVSKKLVNVCVSTHTHRRSEDKDTHKRKAACKSFSSSLYFSLSMPATATELIFQFAKRIHWLSVFATHAPTHPHNHLLAHTYTHVHIHNRSQRFWCRLHVSAGVLKSFKQISFRTLCGR